MLGKNIALDQSVREHFILSDHARTKKQSLNLMAGIHPVDFISGYDQQGYFQPVIGQKFKVSSLDVFYKTARSVAEKYSRKKDIVIMGNVGGFYALASLTAQVSRELKNGHVPHLFIVDNKSSNIQNAIYVTLLGQIAAKRKHFIRLLLGLTKDDQKQLKDLTNFKELTEYLNDKKRKYDRDAHLEMLIARAQEIFIDKYQDEKLYGLFKTVAEHITEYLGTKNFYKRFVKRLFLNIEDNADGHLMNNDDLYTEFRKLMDLDKKKYYIHFVDRIDLTNIDDFEKFGQFVGNVTTANEARHELPIDIAYIPHLERMPERLNSFMKKNTQDLILAYKNIKDMDENKRYWVYKPSLDISIGLNAPGLEVYKKELINRVELTDLSQMPKVEGLPRTLFLSNLNIGYSYADEVARENMIDIAIRDKVKTIFIQGLIYSTYFYVENARRALADPEYPTLDSRLRKAGKVIRRLNNHGIEVVVQLGEEEENLSENLFRLYLDEERRRSTGKVKVTRSSPLPERRELNSKWDWVKQTIREHLIPYLFRAGKDLTRFYSENEEHTQIIEMVNALRAYHEGRKLGDLEKYINAKYLENSKLFKIVYETSSEPKEEDDKIGVQLVKNTRYSNITQYVDASKGLEELISQLQNGSLGTSPKQIVADLRQDAFMVKVMGETVGVLAPAMTDDTRYHNTEFLPGRKTIVADRVHKRASIGTNLNYPGGIEVQGDIRERMIITPHFPKVFEMMEHVQRTGIGKDPVSVFLMHDIQLGSLTERPDLFIKAMDYAFYSAGARGVLNIGDDIQGRNYRRMPIENKWLGGVTVGQQMNAFVELQVPLLEAIDLDFYDGVPGNHEWNTDLLEFGHDFMLALKRELKRIKKQFGRETELRFPEYFVNDKGDIVEAPFMYRNINGYGIVSAHKFSERGSGKGNSRVPTTQIASWMRSLGEHTSGFDIGLAAHYHIVEMLVRDNKFLGILGSYAGESGFEARRGYSSQPMGAILHFLADGRFYIELLGEKYLDSYQIQNDQIAKIGLDNHIEAAFTEDIYVLGDKMPEKIQKMYRRNPRIIHP